MTASPVKDTTSSPSHGDVLAPKHVAIIMDGNGRWAKARGLSRSDGHREGVKAARRAVEAARDLRLKYLTLYSFSTENWRRPAGEVRDLMGLLRQFIGDDLPRLKGEGVRVCIIGDRDNLSPDLKALVRKAESETKDNNQFVLQIAFNYGGRDELARATKAIVGAVKSGALNTSDINEGTIDRFIDTQGVPDPDLVIRTSGEKRVSNFLLWQAAYSEYLFLDVLWPDFTAEVFESAIHEYCNRERRYGGVSNATS
ncbi:isoprenyl transferase [Hyphococcus flavus]|uniref:Isoprenyl transferase n=1 Tax=Hyphococcus flavus TaxID=1866326 RepID=A0AAF0CF43_9PROT|nr:isoprenyl transferase [Hyphococcus flavus]WDI31034.1 isoprenyl transferase [Hyphococcus flavus]